MHVCIYVYNVKEKTTNIGLFSCCGMNLIGLLILPA